MSILSYDRKKIQDKNQRIQILYLLSKLRSQREVQINKHQSSPQNSKQIATFSEVSIIFYHHSVQ